MRNTIIFVVCSVLVSYLTMGYIAGEFNPMKWDAIERLINVLIVCGFVVVDYLKGIDEL